MSKEKDCSLIEWEDPFKEQKEKELQDAEQCLFEFAFSIPSGGWYYAKDESGKYKYKRVQACWEFWLEQSRRSEKLLTKAWFMWEFREKLNNSEQN